MLYPLKFKPRFKERIWGGRLLEQTMSKKLPKGKLIGESWEISAVQDDISVVESGELAGNDLQELIEVYMGDLVGEKVYERFGIEFPLLIKLIDAQDTLSIQVHPDDELAAQRHNSYGKTEMWYVVDCAEDAELFLGFEKPVTPEKYLEAVENGTLAELLHRQKVKKGEAYFIPAGMIHAIGKGMLIAEIQQTSDITYRVFDWNRVDEKGNGRELHTELAVGAINFAAGEEFDITKQPEENRSVTLKKCQYFTTNTIKLNGTIERNNIALDSFVIYMSLGGKATLSWSGGSEVIRMGETILVPACMEVITLEGQGELLEIYID